MTLGRCPMRDAAVRHTREIIRLGEAAVLAGNTKLAAEYFHQSVEIVEPHLSTQMPDLAALYVAADSSAGLGDIELRELTHSGRDYAKETGQWAQARSWYVKSL